MFNFLVLHFKFYIMPDVEFSEEESFNASINKTASRSRGKWNPATMAVRLGLAKDETGVNIILISIALIALVLAVIFFVFAS